MAEVEVARIVAEGTLDGLQVEIGPAGVNRTVSVGVDLTGQAGLSCDGRPARLDDMRGRRARVTVELYDG